MFPHILQSLEKIASSDFAATAADSFRSLQESWKAEIERIFGELKEREKVILKLSSALNMELFSVLNI